MNNMYYGEILEYFKSGCFWIVCFCASSIFLIALLSHYKYKKRIIISWILGVGVICFALYSSINYVALHPNDNGNYVSLFTGWLGGICTAILGCMAVVQSRTYNSENNAFLVRQEQIQKKMVSENERQTKKLVEYQNNIDLRQSIERLIEDIRLFVIEIDFLSLLQAVGKDGFRGEELYLLCLQCEMKITMLQKRLNAYSVYIFDQSGDRAEIGTVQKKELGIVLNQLQEKLTGFISDYLKNVNNLETSIEAHKVELTQLCFDISKKYYFLLDVLHEALKTLSVKE